MRKYAFHLIGSLGLIALTSVGAPAATIQFIDTYRPLSPVVLDSNGASTSFSQYIVQTPAISTNTLVTTVDGTVTPGAGFNAETDTLTTGQLVLSFMDVSGNARFDLVVGGFTVSNQAPNATSGLVTFNLTAPNLALLGSAPNSISVALTKGNGNNSATFTQSVLTVNGTRTVNGNGTVPEPTSLALLGLGLLGTGVVSRRVRR